ncbi:MAG TPA: prolipoprotein diacylglyceryl transferase family protein, partial [Anaerolineae bacterium]|nr:prolipoprotein diacylglyceryl transferase family protein [Anaerolineae bacterium]
MNRINPIIFELGPYEVRWYGVLIMLGVALGAVWASSLAAKRGYNTEHVWNGVMFAVVLGIIGARLYHVFSIPEGCTPQSPCGWYWYREHPIDAVAFWKGGFQGLGIYGAIVGGLVGITIYALWQRINPLVWLDLGAVGLPFGQFV